MSKYSILKRGNGLVEIKCEHGIGHPAKSLTLPAYYYGVHGCDGCCSKSEFKAYEARARAIRAQGDDRG